MFIEIGVMQRMSVFMGHPVYALSITLFSIILSTGIGSLLSERFVLSRAAGILLWLSLLVTYLLSVPHWLPTLTYSLIGGCWAVRARDCLRCRSPACWHSHGLWFPDGDEVGHKSRFTGYAVVLGRQWCGRRVGGWSSRRM